jgi:hypothetical protein
MTELNDYIIRGHLLNTLKILDANGWCCATDGSMDEMPIEQQNYLLASTIAELLNGE